MESESWYLKWFGEDYYRVYSHRDDEEARKQVHFLHRLVPFERTPFVIDVACGRGRHVREWENLGAFAVGIDRSTFAILDGKKSGGEFSSKLLLSDMRRLPFCSGICDLLTSMFTSFGYFGSDQEHEALLTEWARVLRHNGNLIIDYLNRNYALKNLVPESVAENEDYRIVQRRSITEDKKRLEKEIEIERRRCGSKKSFTESVRAYAPEELTALLHHAGFEIVSMAGDFSGSEFSSDSERCIVHARKSEAPGDRG